VAIQPILQRGMLPRRRLGLLALLWLGLTLAGRLLLGALASVSLLTHGDISHEE
jgi:hypothetical protein